MKSVTGFRKWIVLNKVYSSGVMLPSYINLLTLHKLLLGSLTGAASGFLARLTSQRLLRELFEPNELKQLKRKFVVKSHSLCVEALPRKLPYSKMAACLRLQRQATGISGCSAPDNQASRQMGPPAAFSLCSRLTEQSSSGGRQDSSQDSPKWIQNGQKPQPC